MKNKRLGDMMVKAVSMDLKGGLYLLDCFMGRCIREDVSHTITTRTAEDKNTWVLEIDEEDSDK